jgi:transposase
MAMRKRDDSVEVFPNAAGIDAGGSSHWWPCPVLEQRGLTVWLVDARQMRYVPGRKSDVLDCQWLQKLMSLGCCGQPGARRPRSA